MLDHDEVCPSNSSNPDKNEVNRSLVFVIYGVWIVSPNRDRRDGNQKHSEDYDDPAHTLHGNRTPSAAKRYASGIIVSMLKDSVLKDSGASGRIRQNGSWGVVRLFGGMLQSRAEHHNGMMDTSSFKTICHLGD